MTEREVLEQKILDGFNKLDPEGKALTKQAVLDLINTGAISAETWAKGAELTGMTVEEFLEAIKKHNPTK